MQHFLPFLFLNAGFTGEGEVALMLMETSENPSYVAVVCFNLFGRVEDRKCPGSGDRLPTHLVIIYMLAAQPRSCLWSSSGTWDITRTATQSSSATGADNAARWPLKNSVLAQMRNYWLLVLSFILVCLSN